MKSASIAALATFTAAVVAAPAGDHVRRSLNERGHNIYAPHEGVFLPPGHYGYGPSPTGLLPTGAVPPYPNPTGVSSPSWPYPTGVLPPYPSGVLPAPSGVLPPGTAPTGVIPGGLPSCPINGVVVCNGPTQFGLCNWGRVFFMDVADGTACVEGKIVGTGIYAAPTPTPTL